MDITALSTSLSTADLMTNVSVSVLNKSLDTVDQLGESLISMLEQSVQPHLGQNLDIKL